MTPTTEAVIAKAAVDYAAEFVKSLAKGGHTLFRDKIMAHLQDFESYLSTTYQRCQSVKLITDRSQVHRLDEIYVPANYTVGDKSLSDFDVCQLVRDNERCVVLGFGGAGKTILMKHLWLSIFRESSGRIPVFIELKRLAEHTEVNLEAYVRRSLSPSGRSISESEFVTLANSGRFIFILDAFDEIADDARGAIQRQIQELSERFRNCGVVVSSRNDERFSSWEHFTVARALPFSREQIKSVIDKIPFDKKVRNKFKLEVLEKKYENYQSFLESPLLAIMMLLTFDQFADVPDKVHIFYRYAFYTLYSLHDAGKEAFRRARKSTLDEDQFKKLFSIFCLSTYLTEQTSFEEGVLRREMEKAAKHAGVKVSIVDYISEVCESVNLLYKEGDTYSFVHRSFQEYFSAFAITNYFPNDVQRLLDAIRNSPADVVFGMAYEMNSNLIEEKYLVPKYDDNYKEIEIILDQKSDWSLVANMVGMYLLILKINSSKGSKYMHQISTMSKFSDYIGRVYAFGVIKGSIYNRVTFDDRQSKGFGIMYQSAIVEDGDAKKSAKMVALGFGEAKNLSIGSGNSHVFSVADDRTLEIVERGASAFSLIKTFLVGQKAAIVQLDRSMKAVKQRVKARGATLDDLLG